jgi:hypothetical protein
MKYESYDAVRIADDLSSLDFISTGKHGAILKRIVFEPMEMANVYFLAFGNIISDSKIDDYSVSDNGDRNKILATVAEAVDSYTKRYPSRILYFTGSTKERTRLYRMAIGLNLEELSLTYEIYGRVDNDLVPFYKNLDASAFLIKRKSFDYPFTTI